MRDFPTIAAVGNEPKLAPPNSRDVGTLKKNCFYHLQANKRANLDDGTGK